jgi:hypothetical protein
MPSRPISRPISKPIRRILKRKPPRNASVLTFCRRGERAEASHQGQGPTRAFLRELRRVDKGLEVYWHPAKGRWVLYRVARRGEARSADCLVKEADLAGPRGEYRPLGTWVIDWLRKRDLTRSGSDDPDRARRLWLDRIERDEREEQERKAAYYRQWDDDIANSAQRIIGTARFSREIRAGPRAKTAR